jgi:hypothetical protein
MRRGEGVRAGLGAGILGVAVVCLTLLPARAQAEAIYSYTDAHGVKHFTNTPVDGRWERCTPSETTPPPAADTLPREVRYDGDLRFFCSSFDVDPALAKAVMKVESDFNPRARSVAGAMGLMQLMPETAERLGVRDPYDPRDNIKGGVKYLGKLLRQYGSHRLALAAYNAGENAVEKYGGIPPYRETQNYVTSVLRHYEVYRQSVPAGAPPSSGDGGDGSAVRAPDTRIHLVQRADGVMVYTNVPWVYQEKAVVGRHGQ